MSSREWMAAIKLMAVGAWLGVIIANALGADIDGRLLGIGLGIAVGAIFDSLA